MSYLNAFSILFIILIIGVLGHLSFKEGLHVSRAGSFRAHEFVSNEYPISAYTISPHSR